MSKTLGWKTCCLDGTPAVALSDRQSVIQTKLPGILYLFFHLCVGVNSMTTCWWQKLMLSWLFVKVSGKLAFLEFHNNTPAIIKLLCFFLAIPSCEEQFPCWNETGRCGSNAPVKVLCAQCCRGQWVQSTAAFWRVLRVLWFLGGYWLLFHISCGLLWEKQQDPPAPKRYHCVH